MVALRARAGGLLAVHVGEMTADELGAPMSDEAAAAQSDDDQTKLAAYRPYLVDLFTRTQEEFDRTLLALAGGGLGVSFAFVKDFLGTENAIRKDLLVASWICWIVTLGLILLSHWLAAATAASALNELDTRKMLDPKRPGGWLGSAVTVTTGAAGGYFLAGLIMMVCFITRNVR